VLSAALALGACRPSENDNSGPSPIDRSTTASTAESGGPTTASESDGTSSTAPTGSGTSTGAASPSASAAPGPEGHFTPTKLKPGEKPPQFVVLSFDGVGWHEKWQYWQSISDQVPLRFTGFLTGLYLLDADHKDAYHGPGHGVGKSSLGAFNSPADVIQEVKDLNEAWQRGDEIGTHFNGHFCSDNRPGANDWSTAQWNDELDQFFKFFKNYKTIDQLPDAPALEVPADTVKGERTPCLEGHPDDFFPALKAHGFVYDSSPTRRGIYWPTQKDGIWQMGMAEFPLAGTHHFQITMDYNFWYTQEQASSDVSPAQSKKDSEQVQQTYQNMFDAAYQGNRAPLILGNHFEDWNNNAYTEALGNFALANCGKPDVECVPFIDVVRWMEAQDPAVLASLQALPPEYGPPGDHTNDDGRNHP
jgi:hypothetical protein